MRLRKNWFSVIIKWTAVWMD